MKKLLLSLITVVTLATAQNSNITNSDPFQQMDKMFQMQMKQMELMQKQMDEMFKTFNNTNVMQSSPVIMKSNSFLSSGLQDKKDHYEIAINVGKGNVKADVKAKDGILMIKVTSTQEQENNNTQYGVMKSYANSSYMQSFTLPKDADEKKIDYDLKDGKLVVKIEKKKNN